MRTNTTVKTSIKTPANKRDIFGEIMDGFSALEQAREGKLTLHTYQVSKEDRLQAAPVLAATDIVRVRESLKVSRPVFAHYLRTNPRTIENWEQGRARPNSQASLLISMVARYPDTLQRLASV